MRLLLPGWALLLMRPRTTHLLWGRGGLDVERIVGLLLLSGFSPLRVRTKQGDVLIEYDQNEPKINPFTPPAPSPPPSKGKWQSRKKVCFRFLSMCYITLASSFSSTSVWRGRECLGSSLAKIALGCSSSDSLSDGGSLIQESKSSLHTLIQLYFSLTNANDLWSDHIK